MVKTGRAQVDRTPCYSCGTETSVQPQADGRLLCARCAADTVKTAGTGTSGTPTSRPASLTATVDATTFDSKAD